MKVVITIEAPAITWGLILHMVSKLAKGQRPSREIEVDDSGDVYGNNTSVTPVARFECFK